MRVVVPFAAENPKTRLAGVLDADERAAFARSMLADVLDAVRGAGGTPTVLATAPVDLDAGVRVDDRSLTTAVNAVLEETDETVAIVMADLPLATPAVLERLFDADGGVVIAPGRGAGTNALVVRHDGFRTDFHGASYLDHREAASAAGVETTVVDSHRLATDVDERADLVEVLVHGDGRAATWLANHGVRIERGNGRVNAARVDD
ncbi:2-phospho-L-lactate guanylyltransferase [Haloarchaeobius salinus]|uniref:2-phospho-L-lactate guanylyltransferase n=1 Tax=Haloarchaeobius salinus TaxID=1198298 RepID=UPI00210E1131|nr:2-phospho-L-lactate guanylyltransferase [Haloarchaeobius salinus]